ncbi:MAG: class I SAM-dependent methyltransferase, partial [Acidimicrobiales bacterium]|nr:class I SAM-dependent methyltransferase [Acidimicrobiales bacterium]
MTRRPRTTPEQLGKARIRTWLETKVLAADAPRNHARHGDQLTEVIGGMRGTVVEIGPGAGPNMRYYAPGTSVIAVEPNPNMHAPLRASAAEHGVDLEIRTVQGERIDVDDASVDGVVGTLVLCGVDDPAAVVAEVRRILKPGGT